MNPEPLSAEGGLMLLLARLLPCHGDQLLIGSYNRLQFSLPFGAEELGLFAAFFNVSLPPPDFSFAICAH